MATQESYIQHLEAQIVRWFSKDSERLTVYYARDGKTHPVTRDEQDRCLERAYGYVRAYADALKNKPSFPSVGVIVGRCITFILFWPCLWMVSSDLPFPLNFAGLAAFFAIVWVLSLISEDPRGTCLKEIKSLRAEFEQRITLRNPVNSRGQRKNSFLYVNWLTFGILGVLAVFGRTIISTVGVDERTLMMIFLSLVVVFFGSVILNDKLNVAHVRQTGHWFRWRSRRG